MNFPYTAHPADALIAQTATAVVPRRQYRTSRGADTVLVPE